MHTKRIGGTVFHYNSDLSGEVEIVNDDGTRIKVVALSLEGFIAELTRETKIAKLQNMTRAEVLFGPYTKADLTPQLE